MELLRLRQRRIIRRLFNDGVLDIDVINVAALEMGIDPVVDPVEPIMIEVAPPARRLAQRTTRNDGAGVVYVLRASNGLHKIGSARNLAHRVTTLQTASADALEIVHTINTKQHSHFALEHALHERLANKRVRGEWFNLTDQDIAALRAIPSPNQSKESP